MPSQHEANEKTCDDNEAPKYQNTYRLEPRNPFKVDLVDKIVKSVMNNRLEELAYDDAVIAKLCGDVASEIRRRVKKLNFDRCVRMRKLHSRSLQLIFLAEECLCLLDENPICKKHKIIVTVTIIEKASQSMETALGFLWDSEKDNYSLFSLEGRTIYAQCCVFGVYYE